MQYSRAVLLVCTVSCLFAGGTDTAVSRNESALRQQVQRRPENFEANHLLAELLIQQHKLSAAIPFLEKARQIDVSHYANSYDLALAYLQTGLPGKSRKVISDLVQRGDKAELHNLLGDIEEAEGNVQEAARQYEIAAQMDPSEKNVFDLGSDLILHQGYEPAVKVFVFGTGRYPSSARMRVGLGVTFYSLGRYDEAVESLCQAVDLDPLDTKALDFLGQMHDISKQYADEVTRRLAHFAQVYPQNAAAGYYYALSLRKRGSASASSQDARSAQEFLQRAVKLKPGFADAHYELGMLFEEEGHAAEAIREYEAAIRLQPDLAKGHYHLARLYKKAGRTELADQEFRSFKRLNSKQ